MKGLEKFCEIILVLKLWLLSLIRYIFSCGDEVSELPSDDAVPSDPEVLEELPSIFVDKALLPSVPASCNNDVPMHVFGRAFIDETFDEDSVSGKFRRFKVYSTKTKMDDVDMAVNDDRHLEYYTEVVPYGIIINANVFLNSQQWNTLSYVSETSFYCAVCGVYCDEIEHVKLDSHKTNLMKHKPLYKYDLSIVRRINNYYHCGVCNILFNVSLTDDHFTSKEHEDKMLFAINKVSDIMYDSNTHNEKADTYHYSAKAINNNNIDLSSDDDDDGNDSDHNDYGNSYGDLKYVENEDEEDDDDFYDNVEPPLNLEHSYASMARRPKTDELPKVLEIDLGNKKVTVKYNSWNMVINPKPNRFYCMVCTEFGHVRQQAEHCRSLGHVEKLAKCGIVHAYDMHLVRQVDDKLYHCAHCNNLQLIHEMHDHIDSHHPAKHTDSPARTPLKNNNNTTNNNKENMKNAINNSTIKKLDFDNSNVAKSTANVNEADLKMYNELILANSNVKEDSIVIFAYGRNIKISKMAFNIVCARENDYYCGLCEVNVDAGNIKQHINSLQHIILLQRTPFIEAFNIHMFRQIREALHCALCNELIQLIPAIIYGHKYEQKHMRCYDEALGHTSNGNKPQKPLKSIDNNNSSNTGNRTVKVAKDANNMTVKDEKAAAKEVIEVADDKSTKTEDNFDNIASTEFIEVKNGGKEELDVFDDTDESVCEDFDVEEYVYVKLGTAYIKITNTAYNTLVDVGDGTKYCFVCAFILDGGMKKHVDSRGHMENMEKCLFVDKYKEDLLRQIYLMYHCSICNVLITRKQVTQHLSWPTHELQAANTKITGKQRKSDIRSGMKQYDISTVKENIYLNETEAKVKIFLNINIQKDDVVDVDRRNKIIIFNDYVLKIDFDAWHSICQTPKGWKCKMCQCEFDGSELANHITSDWHCGYLEKFEKKYSPALIRKINDTTLNCVVCNAEVSNKKDIVVPHIQGKKHKRNFDIILEKSSVANTYADCDENVLTL